MVGVAADGVSKIYATSWRGIRLDLAQISAESGKLPPEIRDVVFVEAYTILQRLQASGFAARIGARSALSREVLLRLIEELLFDGEFLFEYAPAIRVASLLRGAIHARESR